MLLFVGLGNPNPDNVNNRHNIGFKIIDAINNHFKLSKQKPKFKGLLTTGNIDSKKIYAIKPLTFMNNSGTAIKELIKQLQSIPKEYEDYGVRVLYNDIDEDTVDTFDPSENFWVDSVDVNDCRRLAKELVIVGYRH